MNYPNVTSNDIFQSVSITGKYKSKDASVFNIIGRRSGFTSNSIMNDVKEFDNAVANIPVLSNSSLDIISSSVNDTALGTGVRTVKITYIDSNYDIDESPPITLNGTALVSNILHGVNDVLWMETDTAGSSLVAAGNIRARIAGGTVEVEQISAGGNKSLSARFTVPQGYTGYISKWDTHAINNDQDVRLRATVNTLDRSLSSVYKFQDTEYTPINTASQIADLPFLKMPELTKIKCSTISAATSSAVRCDVSFIIIIIKN